MIKKFCLLSSLIITSSVNAIGISSMMEVAHENKAEFIITNPASYRQFLHVGIKKINVNKNGDIDMIPFSRNNIDIWDLIVRPSKTVIDPKLNKTFKLNLDIKNVKQDIDHAYQLSFIPTPYFEEGEVKTHAVKVAIGFAPTVIFPAKKDKPIKYHISYMKNKILLKNYGDTYLRAYFNACPKKVSEENRKKCSMIVYGLSDRHLTINLPNSMKKYSKINVELSTHNSKYKENFILVKGGTFSNSKV